MPLTRIVSGGQTGVDRGALDAALESGFQCGGWCPQGRQAEDNPIPARYPLTEIAGGGYAERTLKNVLASDGSAILYFRKIEGGTQQTMVHCIEHGKPHETIDAASTSPEEARCEARSVHRGQQCRGAQRRRAAGEQMAGRARLRLRASKAPTANPRKTRKQLTASRPLAIRHSSPVTSYVMAAVLGT